MAEDIDFDMANLALAMDRLAPDVIDTLPFGVIAIDRFGIVLLYNRTEMTQSGYKGAHPAGQDFFKISCFGGSNFRGRIEEAFKLGDVDLEIGWFGDFADPGRSLRIRVQSGAGGKLWLFIQRDPETEVGREPNGNGSKPGCRSTEAGG